MKRKLRFMFAMDHAAQRSLHNCEKKLGKKKEIRPMKKSVLRMLLLLTLSLAATQVALADGTCTALVGSKWSQSISQYGSGYVIELTIHREDWALVTYSSGWLAPDNDGSFSGESNQLFSNRMVGSQQPFNVNAADKLDLTLSPTGRLIIVYTPFNITVWDLSCEGSMLTKYVPGFGRVTLTFRNLYPPIQ